MQIKLTKISYIEIYYWDFKDEMERLRELRGKGRMVREAKKKKFKQDFGLDMLHCSNFFPKEEN
jgi:hypothetical protein